MDKTTARIPRFRLSLIAAALALASAPLTAQVA